MSVPQPHPSQHGPHGHAQQPRGPTQYNPQQLAAAAQAAAARQSYGQMQGQPGMMPGVPTGMGGHMIPSHPQSQQLPRTLALPSGDEGFAGSRKRHPTDRSLPRFEASTSSESLVALGASYSKLQETEQKLDWTVTRRKVELEDMLKRNRVGSIKRTLRLWISTEPKSQPWQLAEDETAQPEVNFQTGEGVPSWTVKVEGKLLPAEGLEEEDDTLKIRETERPFSTLISRARVEFSPNPAEPQDKKVVEWKPDPSAAAVDGFSTKRIGSTVCPVQIQLAIEHFPERFKLPQELANLIGLTEASKQDCVSAIWGYVKKERLYDHDRRMIRPDARLAKLFGPQNIRYALLPEALRRYYQPPDPVVIGYTADPTEEGPRNPVAYDIDVEVEDPAKAHLLTVFHSLSQTNATTQQIVTLDEQISSLITKVKSSKLKRDFYTAFASDPQASLADWLASQSRDLDMLLGSDQGSHVAPGGEKWRAETMRRSEYYNGPSNDGGEDADGVEGTPDWLREAVGMHLTRGVAQAFIPQQGQVPGRRR